MLKKIIENVRTNKPLIHNITNYVTVNDCANVLLACGGSPIMADDISEVEEITAICGGLNINIGTLNNNTIPSMFKACKKANELNHPIVLDPVGAGASTLRTQSAKKLLDKTQFTVIKSNISEFKALSIGTNSTNGVDACQCDEVTEENLAIVCQNIKKFAKEMKCIIAVTGKIDIVTDGTIAYAIRNGNKMMSQITGTGCMLSAMMSAYVCANQDELLKGAVGAVCAMGVCGEIAYERLNSQDGNCTYRNYIIDAICNLDGDTLERRAKYEII